MSETAAPSWLSTDQQRVWRAYLLGQRPAPERIDADLRAFGLDGAEYEILVNLSEDADRRLPDVRAGRGGPPVPVPAHPHHHPDGEGSVW